jgi:uncharacterized protein (DUF58 family)
VTAPDDTGRAGAWLPTRAFGRAILVVSVVLLGAVFTRRADLVILAAPIAIGAAMGLWWRPGREPHVALHVDTTVVGESGDLAATIDIANHDRVRYDLVVARLAGEPWLRVAEINRPYVSAIAAGDNVGIDISGVALRWGRYQLGPVVAHAIAADGLLISPVAVAPAVDVKVYPTVTPFDASDAMPRASGMAGFHRSRRPGEGGELAGVRVFSPGDRLRRIDWRVSLRTRQLHVASTLSERDAEIVMLLDVLHEAGTSGGVNGERSVLDTTVRAAAGIGDHYLHRGDRVAFIEYGWQGRRLRPSSGHRQYLTSLEWLLDVRAARGGQEPPPFMIGAQLISPNAMVIVLTPLIDPKSAAMLARLARSGRFVIAVDTMPSELLDRRPPGCGGWSAGTRSASCASTACRWCPGAGRAASTRCSRRCPGWRWRRECGSDMAALTEMSEGIRSQVDRVRTVTRQASTGPLVIRGLVFLAGLVALAFALPPSVVFGPGAALMAAVAALPALTPRGPMPTLVMLAAVGAWMANTGVLGTQISLWRVVIVGFALYVLHVGAALAAVLPYDSVISPGVFAPLAARLGVVAVCTVGVGLFVLTIPSLLGSGHRLVGATLAGFVLMLTLAIYLSYLGNRRQ